MNATSPFSKRKLASHCYFIELLACVVYLGFLGYFTTDLLGESLRLAVAILAAIAFISNIFVQNRKFFNLISIVLLSLSIGLVAFNYLPSLSLGLLLCYRLMVLPKTLSVKRIFQSCLLIGGTLFVVYCYLPPVILTTTTQNILNHISVLLTLIFFGYNIWQLLMKLRQARQDVTIAQSRIRTLVSVTSKLSRFVPPQIWQPIVRSNQPLNVSNQRRKLTILFSDIVGFTELSDNLSPAYLADILNTYFGRMTAIATKHGATLDKFIGDGMLCFFGDMPHSNDKENALKCAAMALEMRRTMHELRRQWQLLGFGGLYVRIGINTGECHVGNFGSIERMSYTLIGKAANLASRLESVAEKDQILISESTFLLIEDYYSCELIGNYQLKGLSKPIPVWQLLEQV